MPERRRKSGGDPRSRPRGPKVRVKKTAGMTESSKRWLERQLNDPYVAEAKRLGYRSRAAFKLAELDDRFGLLKGARHIVDLGAAPGGWSQLAAARLPGARIVGIDLLPVDPVPGATFLEMDFLAGDAEQRLIAAMGGPADLVLSDLAPSTTGHKNTDHLRTMALCEAAFDFACRVLRPGGAFVAKVLRGGADHQLLARMRQAFATVKHAKPPASRADSSEWYIVAQGFKGDDQG
ncbi:MAG: RlmE family RNA methyltransferase [Sphingomonadales bacterium]